MEKETIYTFAPTAEELDEINGRYRGLSEAQYLAEIEQRAEGNNTSADYERTVDLQELFSIRKDAGRLKHYTHIIDTEFTDITSRIFNE